jgi:hypothetical protein
LTRPTPSWIILPQGSSLVTRSFETRVLLFLHFSFLDGGGHSKWNGYCTLWSLGCEMPRLGRRAVQQIETGGGWI